MKAHLLLAAIGFGSLSFLIHMSRHYSTKTPIEYPPEPALFAPPPLVDPIESPHAAETIRTPTENTAELSFESDASLFAFAQNNIEAAFEAIVQVLSKNRVSYVLMEEWVWLLANHLNQQHDDYWLALETLKPLEKGENRGLYVQTALLLASESDLNVDPEHSLKQLQTLGDKRFALKLANSMTSRWMINSESPTECVRQFMQMSDPEIRQLMVNKSLLTWLRRRDHFDRLFDLLEEFPRTPEYDGAIVSIVRELKHEAPAAVMSWAESIANPKMRKRSIMETAIAWLESDNAGFQDWLKQNEGSLATKSIIDSID